ncbi:MAG: ferritin-like domain-containing protein, partial [Alphaproteobacteria bacterium]
MSVTTLSEAAVAVLMTKDAHEKANLSRELAKLWFDSVEAGDPMPIGNASPPDTPARPDKPELLNPRDVPRRRTRSQAGRVALLHAIAHIELNAIDLHWDIIARFSDTKMPRGFYDDWVKSAAEESKHFMLLSDRLKAHDSYYGAMPAHAFMWQAAEDTAQDFLGRLAV